MNTSIITVADARSATDPTTVVNIPVHTMFIVTDPGHPEYHGDFFYRINNIGADEGYVTVVSLRDGNTADVLWLAEARPVVSVQILASV